MDSVEVHPNKGGFNRVVFDSIQKKCSKCGKINTIPEYIKHNQRPVCAQCRSWLLDKNTVVEKIKTVNNIVEVDRVVEVEKVAKVERTHETDDFVVRFRESNDRNEDGKIVLGILLTGIALLLLVYQFTQN